MRCGREEISQLRVAVVAGGALALASGVACIGAPDWGLLVPSGLGGMTAYMGHELGQARAKVRGALAALDNFQARVASAGR